MKTFVQELKLKNNPTIVHMDAHKGTPAVEVPNTHAAPLKQSEQKELLRRTGNHKNQPFKTFRKTKTTLSIHQIN